MVKFRAEIIILVFSGLLLAVLADNSGEDNRPPTDNSDSTSLERAHWCAFSNGTRVPLGHIFLHKTCSICQCMRSRQLICRPLQCMPTYCIDNSMPSRKQGQCCTQCAYEEPQTCLYNNISYPHGSIMKSIEKKMTCWCQLGNIECRNHMASLFQGMDMLSDGTTIYVVVIVIAIVLIFGLLLCCACTLGFYYYYQRNQQAFQEAYDQYVNNAGWQPMSEGQEYTGDIIAEEKRMEAEKYENSNYVEETVPPPYAGYNGPYASETEKK